MLLRHISSRAADATADIEEAQARLEAELRGELDRRLPATSVELVDRGEVIGGQVSRIFAGVNERIEDRLLQRWARIVLRNLLLDAHGSFSCQTACRGNSAYPIGGTSVLAYRSHSRCRE